LDGKKYSYSLPNEQTVLSIFNVFNESSNSEHKGKILPLVYTLLNRKNEKVYFEFFNMFADVHELAQTEITLDFELATINAVLKVWPRIIIWLCWFHYTQNFWKNIQLKQLAKDYIRVEIVRKLFKYL
jgi:hypothetical protein